MPACLYPLEIDDGSGGKIKVRCGHCIPCRIAHSIDWQIRLRYELESWNYQALFITLTYSDENVPISEKGTLTLRKKDLQNYIKRVRKELAYDKRTCRYFACGEYGGSGVTTYLGEKRPQGRPHYHLILFGVSPSDVPMLHQEWKNDAYPEWTYGCVYGEVTEKSIGYVTNYCMKKQRACDNRAMYDDLGLLPPFQLSSQGLGYDGFLKEKERINHDKCIIYRGKPRQVPRYFKEKSGWTHDWNDEFISELEALSADALRQRFDSARKLGYTEGLDNMSGSKKRQILADYIYSQSSSEKQYSKGWDNSRKTL